MDSELGPYKAAGSTDGTARSTDRRGRTGQARSREGSGAYLSRTRDSARAVAPLALLGLALAGCVPPSLAGQWHSTTLPNPIEVTLSVKGTRVSGSGTLFDGRDRKWSLNITGEYTAPTFSLELASQDQILGRYIGRLDSADMLRGVLYDAGVLADSVILARTRVAYNVRPLFQPVW